MGVRLLVVGVAVEAQGIKSSQGRAEKERYGRLRQIGLLGLLQVSSGKAMNRNSIAGAGERNQNSFRVEKKVMCNSCSETEGTTVSDTMKVGWDKCQHCLCPKY